MGASLTEVHMGLGGFALDHDYDPAIAAVLAAPYCHLVLYWGEEPFYAGVVTEYLPTPEGIRIAGRGLDWWLGLDSDGPLILDREYIAGNNKFSNGAFVFGDFLWRQAENSLWAIDEGAQAATHSGGALKDDVLAPDESFECRPGASFRASATLLGGLVGLPGRVRLRTIYDGRFLVPNILPNPNFELDGASRAWEADSATYLIITNPNASHSGQRTLNSLPIPKPQLFNDPSFELGGTGWGTAADTAFVSTGNAHSGSYAVRVGPNTKPQLLGNNNFELGSSVGWGTATYLTVVNDATNARSGGWVLRGLPITRPQLLGNYGFEAGTTGWGTATYLAVLNVGSTEAHAGSWALRAAPITRPQLLANYGFESGASSGWGTSTLGFMTISNFAPGARTGTWVMIAFPLPRPELLANHTFESGATGWTGSSGDISIVNSPANAYNTSSWAMRTGPSTKLQRITDPGFETGLGSWTQVAGTWYQDSNSHYDGSYSATTAGGGPASKYMAYGSISVTPGERYRYEAKIRATQDSGAFDGVGHVSLLFYDTAGTTAKHWLTTARIKAGEGEPGVDWQSLAVEFEVADDIGFMKPHVVVEGHTVGWWSFDTVKLTRLNNNTDEIFATAVTVEAQQSYEVSAYVRSGPGYQAGDVSLRVKFSGSGQPDQYVETFRQGNTKNKWVRLASTVRPPDLYDTAQVSVLIHDIAGDYIWLDQVALEKADNIVDEIAATAVTVASEQSYEMSAYVRSNPGLKSGTVRLRAKLTGSGQPDQYVESSPQGDTKNLWVRLASTVRPPEGYTSVQVSVVARDIVGQSFFVDQVGLEKADNNTDEIAATAFTVTPEQNYELAGFIRSGPAIKSGDVVLRAKLSGTGVADQYVDSSRQGSTRNKWVRVATTFRPPEGYTSCVVSVLSKDISGDYFYVDDLGLEKADNNRDEIVASSFSVLASQSYDLSAMVRSGAALKGGTLSMLVKLTGSGQPDLYVESSRQGNTKNQWIRLLSNVRVPANYTTATVSVATLDVTGDSFWVDEMAFEKADNNTTRLYSATAYTVVANSRYELTAAVRSKAQVKKGTVVVGVVVQGAGLPDLFMETQGQGPTADEWRQVFNELRPPDGYTIAVPYISGTDIEGESFYVDDMTLTKVSNNTDSFVGASFPVTPERTYHWSQWVRSGPGLSDGNVRLSLKFAATGRPDVVMDSSPIDDTHNVWKLMSFDFTPPSGYSTALPSIVSTDVFGDSFFIDDGEIRDNDDGSIVFDQAAGPGLSGYTTVNLDTTAPVGAEKVRVEVVAEANGDSYTLDGVSLVRTGLPIATTGQIVRDMLLDPLTGLSTCLVPGDIHGSDTIQYDIHLLNLPARQVLLNLARNGQALPVREFRVNPDFTVDFGQDFEICEDRPEVVLTPHDLVLLANPQANKVVENLVTDITVVGAERQTPGGLRKAITGTATALSSAKDRFGHTVRRTRVVQESTIGHVQVAMAYAQYLLDRANRPQENVRVSISDWRALGGPDPTTAPGSSPHFRPGDWVYVEQPEAGLVDEAYEQVVRGRVAFPARKRVVSRTTRLGAGTFRAELLPSDGTDPIPLPHVQWEPSTTAELELGDLLPDFAADPQGGSVGNQFLRFRASSPR
jgi:hypothetical protein